MFVHQSLVSDRDSRFHLLAVGLTLLFLLISCTIIQAQGVGTGRGDIGGTGGGNIIKGRVRFPSGGTVDSRIKIQLESTTSSTRSTVTNTDGEFVFSNLPPGPYTLIVDAGPQYDVLRESVYIEQSDQRGGAVGRQTVNVPIQLRLKGTGGGGAESKPPIPSDVPKDAANFYYKGIELAEKGESKKAVEQLTKAVAAHPQFALALSALGAQYLKLGELDKAIEALRAALKLNPDDVAARLDYGVALLNKKDFAAAEKELRLVVKKNDNSATAHMYLGLALVYLKQSDEAETELARAISLPGGDNLAQAHKYLGAIYWQKGRNKEAADELERYVALAPKAPDAEKIRGTIKDLRAKQ